MFSLYTVYKNNLFQVDTSVVMILQPEPTSLLRLRVIAGHNLCKKDIF